MPTSNELGHRGMDMRSFKEATKTKYKLGSLKGLLCNIHSDTNFITNVKQIIQILKKKADEAVATTLPHFGEVSMTSWNLVCTIGD